MSLQRFSAANVLAVALCTLAIGCAENRAVNPAKPAIAVPQSAAPAMRAGEGTTDSLAMGLALALSDGVIRGQLRDALRDSPFRAHAIDLVSFLRGSNGLVIAGKAATALGIERAALIRLAESAGNLELVMPRPLDRVSWDGSADIEVTATPVSLRQRKETGRESERGYDVSGNATSVFTLRYSSRPYIIIRPAEFAFPAEAEALRAAAARQSRNTVSTPAEEREAMRQRGRERVAREKAAGITTASGIMFDGSAGFIIIPCGQPGAPPSCDIPPPPPPASVGGGGATLASAMTKNYCYGITSPLNATNDRDNDRVRDDCENAIAAQFAPTLNIGNNDSRPARQPYWALSRHPDHPDNVQIIYAISYVTDGGVANVGWWWHEGDSEFIIVEVKNVSASKWGIIEATLSAHFGAEEGVPPEYQWGADSYYWDDLDYPQGPFPRIWASLEKHANYRTKEVCASGGPYGIDTCGGDYFGAQIPAPPARNVGNYYHLPVGSRTTATQILDCVLWQGQPYLYYVYRTGEECFWRLTDNANFSGWHPVRQEGAAPYWKIFSIFEF